MKSHEKKKKTNTAIYYLYRDASNYKMPNSCVVAGTLSEQQKETILDSLDNEEYFVPEKVGLPAVRFSEEWTQDDHIWFELSEDGFSVTTESPTVEIDTQTLTAAFAAAKGKWEE